MASIHCKVITIKFKEKKKDLSNKKAEKNALYYHKS